MFSIDRVGIPFGSQTIIWTLARHLVSRCLYFPATVITWSIWTNHRSTYRSTWVVLWLLFCRSAPSTYPNKRSTLQGPFREFGESLVVRLYSEIDHLHLSIEAQCVSHLLPMGDCHNSKQSYAKVKQSRKLGVIRYQEVHLLSGLVKLGEMFSYISFNMHFSRKIPLLPAAINIWFWQIWFTMICHQSFQ